MIFEKTETENINNIISGNAPLDWEGIIGLYINDWLCSGKRELMLSGAEYYLGRSDIRKKLSAAAAGRSLKSRSNIKLEHGFVKKLVDQKVGYLFGKLPSVYFRDDSTVDGSFQNKDSRFRELVRDTFDRHFWRTVVRVAKESINKGIAWLQVYFEDGIMKFQKLCSEEIIPVWADNAHTRLESVIRVYDEESYKSKKKIVTTKVEVYTLDGIYFYTYDGKLASPLKQCGYSPHFMLGQEGKNWTRIPIIPFKYNEEEQPLLDQIKSIVDNYNLQASVNADIMADLPSFIYKLVNYGGQYLDELLRLIQEFRVISLDENGDVDKLQAEPNAGVFQLLERTRKDIYEFGRGVDSQTENFGNSSGIALKFRYADLDMDCNIIESEFQAGFEDIFWFLRQYASILGMDASDKAEIVFNRDILISESEVIGDCRESIGIISDETIIANHPWVTDADLEIRRIGKINSNVKASE